jgi:ZIP family zinc transporter
MDALVIGLSFHFSVHVGIIIAAAVISHDFSDGINTFTVMFKAGNSLKASLRMLLIDATAPGLGALSTIFFTVP